MKGSGGTEGGFFLFGVGFLLSALAAWFLLDSVIAETGRGVISSFIRGREGVGGGHRFGETTSMGIIFVPFMVSVIALFYDASKKWAWWLLYLGLAIVAIEILSHLRFRLSMKTSHLLLVLGMFAAGVGMMLRSYRDTGATIEKVTQESLQEGGAGTDLAGHTPDSIPNEHQSVDAEKRS